MPISTDKIVGINDIRTIVYPGFDCEVYRELFESAEGLRMYIYEPGNSFTLTENGITIHGKKRDFGTMHFKGNVVFKDRPILDYNPSLRWNKRMLFKTKVNFLNNTNQRGFLIIGNDTTVLGWWPIYPENSTYIGFVFFSDANEGITLQGVASSYYSDTDAWFLYHTNDYNFNLGELELMCFYDKPHGLVRYYINGQLFENLNPGFGTNPNFPLKYPLRVGISTTNDNEIKSLMVYYWEFQVW